MLCGEIFTRSVFDRDEFAARTAELIGHDTAVKQSFQLPHVPIALLFRGEREVKGLRQEPFAPDDELPGCSALALCGHPQR